MHIECRLLYMTEPTTAVPGKERVMYWSRYESALYTTVIHMTRHHLIFSINTTVDATYTGVLSIGAMYTGVLSI